MAVIVHTRVDFAAFHLREKTNKGEHTRSNARARAHTQHGYIRRAYSRSSLSETLHIPSQPPAPIVSRLVAQMMRPGESCPARVSGSRRGSRGRDGSGPEELGTLVVSLPNRSRGGGLWVGGEAQPEAAGKVFCHNPNIPPPSLFRECSGPAGRRARFAPRGVRA